jgi:zeta-carotene desaturase
MSVVGVVGGGLAGMAAAAVLGEAGYEVDLYEAKPYLGGRATSYSVPGSDGSVEIIDNCQHVLLRCCVNLLDLYQRLGVVGNIEFYREFFFVEPGGRVSSLKAGRLPAPLHFTESFLQLKSLSLREKAAIARGLLAIRREYRIRQELVSMTMLDWLHEKKQPARAIERFWRQILVSAINEELDRMAAVHACQVFYLGFLASTNAYEMGVPSVPLGQLYRSDVWKRWPNVRLRLKSRVDDIGAEGVTVDGRVNRCDLVIIAVPFERLEEAWNGAHAPEMSHSPITGIHLWFDRQITELPHATLLDRTIQWMFNKGGGRQIQLVVSASRTLISMSRGEIVSLAVSELAEYFPRVKQAQVLKAHVVKEVRATFSAEPGVEARRPPSRTILPNVFLAGDYTRSGWPATMEGAVRSGYLAAEEVTREAGIPRKFVIQDIG